MHRRCLSGDDCSARAYSVSLMRSSVRRVPLPNPSALALMTSRVLELMVCAGPRVDRLFAGPSPITHVIYVIKENRTYDQVFGDLPASGDGTPADGDPSLAIFGSRRYRAPTGRSAAEHHAEPSRAGAAVRPVRSLLRQFRGKPRRPQLVDGRLFDRLRRQGFRWNYSGRGRTYDFEGFNRAPNIEGDRLPPELRLPVTAAISTRFMKRFVPYLNGGRDAAEPDSLYLWDAAARTGLSYRNYGEFIGTLSADDVTAVNERREQDLSRRLRHRRRRAEQATLEDHFNADLPRLRFARRPTRSRRTAIERP